MTATCRCVLVRTPVRGDFQAATLTASADGAGGDPTEDLNRRAGDAARACVKGVSVQPGAAGPAETREARQDGMESHCTGLEDGRAAGCSLDRQNEDKKFTPVPKASLGPTARGGNR